MGVRLGIAVAIGDGYGGTSRDSDRGGIGWVRESSWEPGIIIDIRSTDGEQLDSDERSEHGGMECDTDWWMSRRATILRAGSHWRYSDGDDPLEVGHCGGGSIWEWNSTCAVDLGDSREGDWDVVDGNDIQRRDSEFEYSHERSSNGIWECDTDRREHWCGSIHEQESIGEHGDSECRVGG